MIDLEKPKTAIEMLTDQLTILRRTADEYRAWLAGIQYDAAQLEKAIAVLEAHNGVDIELAAEFEAAKAVRARETDSTAQIDAEPSAEAAGEQVAAEATDAAPEPETLTSDVPTQFYEGEFLNDPTPVSAPLIPGFEADPPVAQPELEPQPVKFAGPPWGPVYTAPPAEELEALSPPASPLDAPIAEADEASATAREIIGAHLDSALEAVISVAPVDEPPRAGTSPGFISKLFGIPPKQTQAAE